MKLALMSDVHAEFFRGEPNWLPALPTDADVLVLGGDMHVGVGLIDLVRRISDTLPACHLIVIAGNHEFYRQHREKTLASYREAFRNHSHVHFLENDSIDIDGVRFIGATLWTGFPLLDERFTQDDVMGYSKDTVTDFDCIVEDSGRGSAKTFSPETAARLFRESSSAIDAILERSDPNRTVVITHFPPMKSLLNPRFAVEKITSYFTADCSDIVRKYRPLFWIYGHNHWSDKIEIDGTTFISNQLGYPNELWRMGGTFDPNLTIHI